MLPISDKKISIILWQLFDKSEYEENFWRNVPYFGLECIPNIMLPISEKEIWKFDDFVTVIR